MQTLSYGYKLPETNDKGPVVFPALEDDIQQLNDHTHDGANSAKLDAKSIDSIQQTLASGSWVGVANNQYRQLVTVPAGIDYDKINIGFRIANGDYVYPTVERVSSTQYYVYTNDNTQNYLVRYGN